MHKPRGGDIEGASTTAEMDDRDQAAVLQEVLFIYPEVLTLDELARQMAFASDPFGWRDRIERAVRDLERAGLYASGRAARPADEDRRGLRTAGGTLMPRRWRRTA